MAKESPLNMFHSSAKKNHPSPRPSASNFPPSYRNVDNGNIQAMLNRMDEMRRHLDEQIDELKRNHRLNDEILKQYLGNPSNFSKEEWEFLQQKNHELSNKVWTAVDPSGVTVEPGNEIASAPFTQDPSDNTPKSRKGKFLGSRRKWISTN